MQLSPYIVASCGVIHRTPCAAILEVQVVVIFFLNKTPKLQRDKFVAFYYIKKFLFEEG